MRKRTFSASAPENRCFSKDKNVAVYAMIDSDDTYMLKAQIHELSTYVSAHPDFEGWNIVIYQDSDSFSKAGVRPQLEQLVSDIRAGKVQCVIVKNLSRISRDLVSLMYYIEKIFFSYKVRLISLTENLDTANPDIVAMLHDHMEAITERKKS